jgi:hypothetical protein
VVTIVTLRANFKHKNMIYNRMQTVKIKTCYIASARSDYGNITEHCYSPIRWKKKRY